MINAIKSYIQTRTKIIVAVVAIVGIVLLLALFLTSKYAPKLVRLGPQKLQIACPVPKEYCAKGVPLYKKSGELLGLGFNLPSQTSLSAGFAGKLQQGGQGDGKKMQFHPIVWLLGEGELQRYIATYSFYGTPIYDYLPQKLTQTIKESETIGNVSYETFPKEEPYKGMNFIFFLTKDDKFGPPIPFESIEFK